MPTLHFALGKAGLEVPVVIGLDGQTTTALYIASKPIPPPLLVRGLLDTGSSASSVAPWILQRLGLGSGTVGSTQTASGVAKVYLHHVSIAVLDPNQSVPSFALPSVLAMELPTLLPDADVLIGLDILIHIKLTLDGPQGTFALQY